MVSTEYTQSVDAWLEQNGDVKESVCEEQNWGSVWGANSVWGEHAVWGANSVWGSNNNWGQKEN
jgi:hypothetical protein